MIEYRLKTMPLALRELLEEIGAFIGEEDFKGVKTYLIYSSDDISDILRELNIPFDEKDTDETGWEDKWKEYIKEDYLTDNIYFIFEKGKTFSDNRKTIYINPSLAFGTGTHPTTKIAARLLCGVCENMSILDVGTGSGILSIAATISNAKSVDAFDIDPISYDNCLENIKNNNCLNIINSWIGDIKDIKDKKYDIVCANIISSTLLMLQDDIERLSSKYIIYSGLLCSEYDDIKDRLFNGYTIDEQISINEWVGVRLKKG